MTKSRNVPGQAEGYFLQETRFLYHLLKACAGDVVSLEYLGDVATVHKDGSVTTEEDKSAVKDNPVTDRSVNLWKTLHNWILSVESGDLDPTMTKYVLYVPHKHFTGTFIEKFHDAKTVKEATETLVSAKTELWGNAPKFELKDEVADSIASYVEKVFSKQEIAIEIITNFSFERGADAGYEELVEVIKSTFVPPEHAGAYRKHMLGWVKERIDLCIAKDAIPQISKDEFMDEGHGILRKFDRERILKSVAAKPSRETADAQVRKSPTYIRQLEYINLTYEEKLDAVCDYFMAESDRYTWITRGMLHRSSAEEFDTRLKSKWKNVCGEVQATMNPVDSEQKGAAIYYKCRQYPTKIEGCAVEDHFTHGTYHLLADEPSIGWHPNWSQLLTEETEEDES
jgi:C-terminal domain 7 of the ABC-three component (ABC-3C) systems